MAALTFDCDHDRLRRLLDGDLSHEQQIARHVESCPDCRHYLESIAGDESWWQGIREALSGVSETDVAGSDAFDAVNGVSSGTPCSWIGPPGELLSALVPLDFLTPSDNPAMLGRLGEFEILELIGSGGMGIVLKGYDHELNRYVAVKVLHPHCATSAAARRRFTREAQAAAAIVHQHVVAIHAVGANHYPPYLVMSFVPGESLQQRLNREGPLEVIDALRIGQQVAEGLAAAHAQGLVHRDIKPGNILLERNVERVLLTDFGLARAADDASLTQSGVIAGTPQYMSPEQTHGDAVDHRTDLFSLGTVLYTLLAGHSPFRAETAMGVLRRVCDDTPRKLREINTNVPEWLDALIQKLQAKQPADRFESASQVALLLKGCLSHLEQPGTLALPDEIQSLVKSSRKKSQTKSRSVALIAGVCLMVIVVALMMNFSRQNNPGDGSPSRTGPDSQSVSNETEWNDSFSGDVREINRSINKLDQESDESW